MGRHFPVAAIDATLQLMVRPPDPLRWHRAVVRRGAGTARRVALALAVAASLVLSPVAAGVALQASVTSSDAAAHDDGVVAAVAAGVEGAGATADSAPRSEIAAPSLPAVPTPGVPASGVSPAATAAPTPMPTITAPPRAATVDAPVPATVLASLSKIRYDLPAPYYDHCHVWLGGRMTSRACLYGHTSSHTTIALYGDSHALAWFPALLRVVNDRGWRLLNVTMAACSPADIRPYSTTARSVMTACIAFRKAALAKLAKYHPAVIVVTGTRGFATIDAAGHVLTGAARTDAWVAGMQRTIAKLIPLAGRVVMMADTPNSRFLTPPSCVAANPRHEIKCATPLASAIAYSWLNTEYHVALAKQVAFIDAERWVCPTSPCPLVRGNFVVYRDHGHMTARYAATMWKKLEAAILTVRSQPGAIVGP